MKKSASSFLEEIFCFFLASLKYLRGQISQKHKRDRDKLLYHKHTIIYREEDNRHK